MRAVRSPVPVPGVAAPRPFGIAPSETRHCGCNEPGTAVRLGKLRGARCALRSAGRAAARLRARADSGQWIWRRADAYHQVTPGLGSDGECVDAADRQRLENWADRWRAGVLPGPGGEPHNVNFSGA